MIKETVIAVSVITMAAGAALAPTAASAGEQPLVVADSHDACNPCNPCAGCNPVRSMKTTRASLWRVHPCASS